MIRFGFFWRNLGLGGAVSAAIVLFAGTAGCPKTRSRVPGEGGPVDPRAQATKATTGLVVLHREMTYRFDVKGALTQTVVMRYLIKNRSAVMRYDGVGAAWSPWFQKRPVLTASVRTPDGVVHPLDQATIAVQPVTSGQSRVLTDRRRLHAKLPALTPGAVVTLKIRYQEKRPLVAAGAVHRIPLAAWLPTRKVRLVISAPTGRPLRVAVRGHEMKPKSDETSGERRRIVYEAGPFTKNDLWEPFLPYDRPRVPYVLVSTAGSWGSVADAYRKRVWSKLRDPKAARVVAAVRRKRGRGKLALVTGLLRRMRDKLRYTSLALGDKAIVPVRPRTSMRRGYGDCKDMSTVLVTWLRAAGIPAHLALLRAGTNEDVTPTHPGLDLFNHAIVYVPGGKGVGPLWLDPTSKYGLPKWAPWAVQGRWALVIRPGVKGLTKIPASEPSDNLFQEVREVWYQPTGGARVAETSITTGMQEVTLRRMTGEPEPKKFRKNMKSYAKKVYQTEKLTAVRHTDPRDLAKPFRLRLEMKKAGAFWTDDNFARVKLTTQPVWRKAGSYALYPPVPGSKRFKRKRPLQWPAPFHAVLVYKLTPPPQYVLRSRLGGGHRKLGPATYAWSVRSEAGGKRVVLRYRFTLGKRVWQPHELLTFWRELRRLRQEVPEAEVVFEHRGRMLARKGRLLQSLNVYRDLVRRYSNRPTYHRQLANALGDLGFGLKARAMLQKAARRFPNSAYTHYVLGVHLENDGYGNQHALGWDLEGVKKAYGRACALDPKNTTFLANYARSLSLDKRARFLQGGKAAEPALRAYRRLRTKLKHKGEDLMYAWMLLRARKLDALRRELPGLKIPTLRHGLDVALLVVQKGPGGALQRARDLAGSPSKVPTILVAAAMVLLELGRYRNAARLIGEFHRLAGGKASSRAQLKRMKSYAYLDRSTPTPEAVVMRLLRLAVADRLTPALFRRDLAAKRLSVEGQRSLLEDLAPVAKAARDGRGFGGRLSAVVAADLTLADLRFKVAGDDKVGYHVKAINVANRRAVYVAYLVKEGGAYRIRASWNVVAEVGVEALARLRRGDLKGARKWLDWLRGRRDAPMSPYQGSAFSHLWEAGVKHDRKHTLLAAAVVASQTADQLKGAKKIIERALARRPDRENRIQILRRLRTVYSKLGKFRAAARVTAKLWKTSHRARQLLLPYITNLLDARSVRKAEKVAKRYHKRHPTRWQGRLALAWVAKARKRFDEAKKQYDAIIAKGDAPSYLHNNRAWLGLFLTPFDGARALKIAQRAVTLGRDQHASYLDTLAAIHAEMGQLGAAREAFKKNLRIQGWTKPKKHAWYVYGRIAEQLGLLGEARAAYLRVPKPKRPDPTHTYLLALRRLKVMPAGGPRSVVRLAPLRVRTPPRARAVARPRPRRRTAVPALPR